MSLMPFRESKPLTLGVELEVQLLAAGDLNLTGASAELLEHFSRHPHAGTFTHEITESMLELSTGIHDSLSSLLSQLCRIRDDLAAAADSIGVTVSGGGSHPFQYWPDQTISEAPRAQNLSDFYGYLAKQWTVFGQHIHVGCTDGDQALYLLHALSRYVPHFIALAASSPYSQGADTWFDCSRLNSSLSLPLSGRAPGLAAWEDFVTYFDKLEALEIVRSMKDFYWDIRPKPEFGTIEIRVCDTPLTVERAAMLAAYMQALCAHVLDRRLRVPTEDDFLTYSYTRFTACRFGLEATYIDPADGSRGPLRDHILRTLDDISPQANRLGSEAMVDYLRRVADTEGNDARWIRGTYGEFRSMDALMREQARRWREDDPLLGPSPR
jgi:glutamate---cysteine ligase / carboxylate-amine ligase